MAKYNLLDDDDIFDDNDDLLNDDDNDSDVSELLEKTLVEEESSEESEPPAVEAEADMAETEEDEAIDIDIDEELLNFEPAEELDESTFAEDVDLDISSTDPEPVPEPALEPDVTEVEEEPKDESPAQEESAREASTLDLSMDYEDEKQEGLNYKPIVLGISGVLLIILIYVGVDHFFLSSHSNDELDKTETAVTDNQPAQKKSAEEKAAEEREKRKQAYLEDVRAQNKSRLNTVNGILALIGKNAHLCTLVLYDKSILFEIFSKNRGELARFNMKLKEKNLPYSLVSSTKRPGSSGGILGVFKGEIPGSGAAGSGAAGQTFTSTGALQNALKDNAGKAGVTLKNIKSRSMASGGSKDFKGYELSMEVSGKEDAVKKFMSLLSALNNVKVYKLSLSASDQKSFTGTDRVQLILHAFI